MLYNTILIIKETIKRFLRILHSTVVRFGQRKLLSNEGNWTVVKCGDIVRNNLFNIKYTEKTLLKNINGQHIQDLVQHNIP